MQITSLFTLLFLFYMYGTSSKEMDQKAITATAAQTNMLDRQLITVASHIDFDIYLFYLFNMKRH